MMEGFKRSEKKFGVIETSTAIAALLSALDAAPVQALEIGHHTSWHNGVGQDVRESVRKDKIEHVATYVQFADGSGAWLSSPKGEAQKVTTNIRELQKQARGYGKAVSNICILHTHPTEVNRTHMQVSGVAPESVPIPPSAGDIANARSKELFQQGMDKFTFGAADNLGVWYFAEKKSEGNARQTKIDDNGFRAAYTQFIVKSTRKGFDFGAELPRLQQAYTSYLNGEIRFASYEQIKNESPCAGVGPLPERLTEPSQAATKSPPDEGGRSGAGKVAIDLGVTPRIFHPPQ